MLVDIVIVYTAIIPLQIRLSDEALTFFYSEQLKLAAELFVIVQRVHMTLASKVDALPWTVV